MLDCQMNTPVTQFPATTSDSVGMNGWTQKVVVTECLKRPKLDSAEAEVETFHKAMAHPTTRVFH